MCQLSAFSDALQQGNQEIPCRSNFA